MAENSKIEWCDHTFNPWRGCTKVSPGCAHCYAETLSRRNPAVLGEWGKGKPRVLASNDMWRQPLKWAVAAQNSRVLNGAIWRAEANVTTWDNRDIVERTVLIKLATSSRRELTRELPLSEWEALPCPRPRVFCASLADWLDDEVPIEWLARLLELIFSTPHLDWLLLTKRPQNWAGRILEVEKMARQSYCGEPRTTPDFDWKDAGAFYEWITDWTTGNYIPANVWIGTSVEDQARADERIPRLLSIPAKVRFLSCEPLLGPVDLHSPHIKVTTWRVGEYFDGPPPLNGIHWVIVGGESGPGARPMHPDWARSLRDQCEAASVPFFFKQWGEWSSGNLADGPVFLGESGEFEDSPRRRVGKKRAGRLLEGREWNEFPNLEGGGR